MASLSLWLSAYGLGGIAEPEVACRSLLGGALTVRRSDVLPAAGRAMDADELTTRALVRLYGSVESLAAVTGLETVRAERRAGGMVTTVEAVLAVEEEQREMRRVLHGRKLVGEVGAGVAEECGFFVCSW